MTLVSRFPAIAVALLIGVASPPAASADITRDVPHGAHRIGESVLRISAEGTNCVVIAGSQGLAVVDTGPGPAAAEKVLEAASIVFGRTDVAFVVSTHCHWDHVDGNQVFAATPIIAQGTCPSAMLNSFDDRRRLAAAPAQASPPPPPPPPGVTLPPPAGNGHARTVDPRGEGQRMSADLRDRFAAVRLVLPTITFNDTMTVNLGDTSLHLIAYGSGHSTSDILVVVPEEELLISGDLFFHGQLPLFTGDGQPDPERWMSALDSLDAFAEIRTIIPGHGPPVSESEFEFFERYVRWLAGYTNPAAVAGEPADSLLRGPLSFDNLPGPVPEFDTTAATNIHTANVRALVDGAGGSDRPTPPHP